MLTYLDDHSRFVSLGSEKFYDPTSENALWLLEECVHKYGRPRQVLTDRGHAVLSCRGEGEGRDP
jgi:hypothetical protein